MTVTETLGALGSWEIQLADETPDHIRDQFSIFSHIAIADGAVDVQAVGDGLLTGARYVGVCMAIPDGGLAGSGMRRWLGDEDGKGRVQNELNLSGMTLTQAVNAILAVCPSVVAGTIHTAPGTLPANSKYQLMNPRQILDAVCDAFNVESRVNGNGSLDVGTAAQLYNTEAPDTIIVRKGAGTDMDLVALAGDYKSDAAGWDYSTGVKVIGRKISTTGDTPDELFVMATSTASSVPYVDLFGNQVEVIRLISASDESSTSAQATADLNRNRFARLDRTLKVTAEHFETEGNFVVGDSVYVYDPETGIVDAANEVIFRGEVLHPDVVRASGVTWPVVRGMTVAFRTQTGAWLDLTPFVTWETGGNELTVGDLPKSLTGPTDNQVQVRLDAARGDASIPGPPTGLTLTTSSTLNAQGRTGAVIHASWAAPTLNTDGTTITDLSHYVVEYRWTGRAPQWHQANATDSTELDLFVVPGLPYEVRVTAYDLAGHASTPTATASITSAADAIAPNAPADPVVSSYLGQLRIEYAGTDAAGNPMASDTNRIDVHVGTTASFTADATTRVDSITPFAKGVSYATAPYGATRYVRLIAVDHSGNASASSAVVSGATTQVVSADVFDGAIGTAKLADLAVTTAKINDLAVNDAKIGSLSVGKLTAGTMSADVVVGGRFATALTGARREINALGFQGWDAANNLTINFDGVDNLLTGKFRTGLPGTRRIEMGTVSAGSNRVEFFAPDGRVVRVAAFTGFNSGSECIRLAAPVAGTNQVWNSIQVQDDDHIYVQSENLSFYFSGDTDATPEGSFRVMEAIDKGNGTTLPNISTVDRIFIDRSRTNMHYGGYSSLELYINQAIFRSEGPLTITTLNHVYLDATGEVFIDPGTYDARLAVKQGANAAHGAHAVSQTPPDSGGSRWGAGWMYIQDAAGSSTGYRLGALWHDRSLYVPIVSAGHSVASARATKSNIVDLPGSPLTRLRESVRPRSYRRLGPPEAPGAGRQEIGLVLEEAPPELVVPAGDSLGLGGSVDLYGFITLVAGAVKELSDRLEKGGLL